MVVVQKEAWPALDHCNNTQVKPILRPKKAAVALSNVLNRAFSTYASQRTSFSYPHTQIEEYRHSRKNNEIESLERWTNAESISTSFFLNDAVILIQITQVIDKYNPRVSSIEMKYAIIEEVGNLLQFGTFKAMLEEGLPDGANALTASLVLVIKSNAGGQGKYQARYVIGGHKDKLKHYMVHGVQALQAPSSRLLLALATAHVSEVWTSYANLSYYQSTKPLERRVFIEPLHRNLNSNNPNVLNYIDHFTVCATLVTCITNLWPST